jgi:hypothetical protein
MAHPWPASLLAAAPPLALVAGVAGAILGARISQSLALAGSERAHLAPMPGAAVAAAAVAVVAVLAVPLPRTGGDGTRAAIVPRAAGLGRVRLAATLDPPRAARGAQWFEVVSWRGRTPGARGRSRSCSRPGPAAPPPTGPYPSAATGSRFFASRAGRT